LTKKSIVVALRALLRKREAIELLTKRLNKIVEDKNEDYRVREEAKNSFRLEFRNNYFVEEEQMEDMKRFAYKE